MLAIAVCAGAVTARAGEATPPAPASSARKVFDFALSSGRVAGDRDTIRVTQGDEIELRWSSDRPIALHLHGYDIEVRAAPAAPAVMVFKARLPGRFPVSEHGSGKAHHRAVLYVEVHP